MQPFAFELSLRCKHQTKTKMKPIKALIPLLLFCGILFSCNKNKQAGPIVSETRELIEYDELELRGSFSLQISDDFDFDIEVTAPDNKIRYIETVVLGDRLIISEKNNNIDGGRVTIKASNQFLEYIQLDGSGIINGDSINNAAIIIELNGSGLVDLPVNCTELDLIVNGSGNIETFGDAETVDSQISGSGIIDSKSVGCLNASSRIDGSGIIKVYASESLFARIDGSGVIQYWGNPDQLDTDISGSGQIIDMQ